MSIPNVKEEKGVKKGANETATQASKKKRRSYKIPRRIFLGLVMILFLGILGFVIYTSTDLPPLDEIENPQSALSTQVYSSDGEILDNFFVRENRVPVRLNEISPYVVDALIATEDTRFYNHSGVDQWSIPALVIRNLFRGTSSGASTITMQLSRNLFNTVGRDRTVNRKIKEVIVAAVLEKNYTKQEIIEAYLNTVNIYGNAYGIEMASERLFGKRAKRLEVQEAATLVAMLKGQGVFDPIRRPEKVRDRRNLVINNMVRFGFLDTALVDVDSIQALPLVVKAQGYAHQQGTGQYFRQAVREFMTDWCANNYKANGDPYNFYTDGLRVYTTLDARMQRHAESAVVEHLSELQGTFDKHIKGHEPYKYNPSIIQDLMRQSYRYIRAKRKGLSDAEIQKEFDKPVKMEIFSYDGPVDTTMTPRDSVKYYSRFLETGFVSINPKNGQIKSWVGGIDFQFFKYDHVDKGTRQVGSTFKPFVYGVAMKENYDPCSELLNQPVTFENVDGNGETWTPKNADGQFGGLMTLREGMATSTNLITARLMKEVKPFAVVEFARAAGIESPLEAVPSLCLGTTDLKVKELTGAYATFANSGVHIKPYFITRIEDRFGNVLANFGGEPKEAFSAKTAYKVLELLRAVVDEGTASRLRYKYSFRNEMGGKTGTTQNHSDGWFIGVTPELVGGVWVGCSDRRMRFSSMKLGQGANMALPIWALYMKRLYEDKELAMTQERFERPRNYYVNMNCGPADDEASQRKADKPKVISSDDLDGFE